ncbi:putative Zn-dependent peptidase [Anaerosolibacter carboniphilus]|uniref:Putative Zn-dependent peptidase n=1 Tax=Anaerosolibacter carboniphilus TaxID=1417629 RepID=A0A841KZX8_9FIRM|nr:putative Zn-dependent peptidase [Anaerosolibacter carboniphilus]
MFNSKEFLLDNGIQLITICRDTQISSLHIGFKMGAMYEKKSEKGICHFIEHMLFKGTKKRDNHQINQELEERAGSYSAYTDYASTVFAITALTEELGPSIELLSDMIINSTFPKDEMERERKVILAEIKTDLDDVEQYSYKKINEAAFKNGPLRHTVIGSEKTIKGFSKEQLENYYKVHYIPNQCIISIVSPLPHEEVKKMVENHFLQWIPMKKTFADVVIERNRSTEKTSYKTNIEQSTLIYLYTFHGFSRREELALEILNYKLGESANSILFQALREEKGLSYDIYSEIDTTEAIKTLYIYTAVSEEDIEEARNAINDCIEKIKKKEICLDEKTINLMKKVLKTAVASILEDSESLGSYVLHQRIMGKRIDAFVEDMKELDYIHEDEIHEVAEKLFREPTVHMLLNRKK